MLISEEKRLDIVVVGLSITSSWGNGHATTFRSLLKGLHKLGHRVLFLEHDVPWYASHRDFEEWAYADVRLYGSVDELKTRYIDIIRKADMVIVGSYVVQGEEVIRLVQKQAEGIKAFYDIDTPVTLCKLRNGGCEYLSKDQIPAFDIYLSFTGGPILEKLEEEFYANNALPLFCSVDETEYFREDNEPKWDLGYLGTYSADRQPALEKFIISPATELPDMKFVVAGPQFPESIIWPGNVERIAHIPPSGHRRFYNQQRFTLNVTRFDMIQAGYAPSVRLFEAAACEVPIISDHWNGLNTLFQPEKEILVADISRDVIDCLKYIDNRQRREIGKNAREKVLKYHTSVKRAEQLVDYYHKVKKESEYTADRLVQEYNIANHGL